MAERDKTLSELQQELKVAQLERDKELTRLAILEVEAQTAEVRRKVETAIGRAAR